MPTDANQGGAEIQAEWAKVNGSQGEKVQSEEEEFAAKKIERKGLRKKHERMVFNEVGDLLMFWWGGGVLICCFP